jgi:hypothetical protein
MKSKQFKENINESVTQFNNSPTRNVGFKDTQGSPLTPDKVVIKASPLPFGKNEDYASKIKRQEDLYKEKK